MLSVALSERCGIKSDTRASIYATNSNLLSYLCLGDTSSRRHNLACNSAFMAKELAFQLEASDSKVLFISEDPTSLKNGFEAAKQANIPRDHVVIIQEPVTVLKYSESNYGRVQRKTQGAWTLAGLIQEGRDIVKAKGEGILASTRNKLKPGEGRTKIAFLSFSSGTTGLPKGVAIQHHAVTSNALQTMAHNRSATPSGPRDASARAKTSH